MGNPGGERGDLAAALGEDAEALGGVLGASGGGAVLVGVLGASGEGAVVAGGGVGLAAGGPGGASAEGGQLLSSSSTMAITSAETRCFWSPALATQWVSRVL